jgi:hypothetical protein
MNRRMQMMGDGMIGGMMGPGMRGMMELKRLPKGIRGSIGYLQKHAQKPVDPEKYAELSTPAGKSWHRLRAMPRCLIETTHLHENGRMSCP